MALGIWFMSPFFACWVSQKTHWHARIARVSKNTMTYSKQESLLHVSMFFDLCNVQKSATKFDTSGPVANWWEELWSMLLPVSRRDMQSYRSGGQLHQAHWREKPKTFLTASHSKVEFGAFHTAKNLSEKEGKMLLAWVSNAFVLQRDFKFANLQKH